MPLEEREDELNLREIRDIGKTIAVKLHEIFTHSMSTKISVTFEVKLKKKEGEFNHILFTLTDSSEKPVALSIIRDAALACVRGNQHLLPSHVAVKISYIPTGGFHHE